MKKASFSFAQSMDESHLSQVHDIEQAAYDYPWSLKGFERSLDQGLNYVFFGEEHELLGYCCILPVLDEAHILNLCISPKYQKQGLATQALRLVLNKLKDADFTIAMLEVRESNQPAIKLYHAFGFGKDGVRKGYYRARVWSEEQGELVDGKEDAILMSKSLVEL